MRLLCAAFAIDLSYGEAYYVATARHFALSYFDHPPLSFWLVKAAMTLSGSDALIVLRLPFMLLFAGATWLMYRVGAALYGEWVGALSALLLSISPVFALSIGSWIEPDGPLIFCLLASALCIVRVAFGPKRDNETLLWALAGFWLGLAMLAKYYAILFPIGVALFALTSREHRQWFGKPGPYLAGVIGMAMLSPVLIWNFQHHWASFDYQGSRAFDFAGIDIKSLITNILGQAVFIGPWIWIPMLLACRRPLRDGTADPASWFLLCVAAVPIVFFTAIPVWARTHGHYHWQAPGYLFLFPVLARFVLEKWQDRPVLTLRWLWLSIAAPLVVMAVIGAEAATGWAHSIFRSSLQPGHDFTIEGMEWKDLRPALAERRLLDKPRLFVATANRVEVGKVDLEIGRSLPVVCLCLDPRNIAFGWNVKNFSGWDALIIGSDYYIPDAKEAYGNHFDSIEPLPDVAIYRGGVAVLTLRVYYAKNYRGSYPMPFAKDAR